MARGKKPDWLHFLAETKVFASNWVASFRELREVAEAGRERAHIGKARVLGEGHYELGAKTEVGLRFS